MVGAVRGAFIVGSDMKIWTFFVIMVGLFTVTEIIKGEEKGKMDQEISLPAEAEGWKWDGKEVLI